MTAYTDFHYSPTGSGVISGAQVLEQTEQGINGLGQYVQDNVSGAIDTANQALTTAHNADSNATAAINLANSFNAQIIAANQTAGNALTTAQSAQNTANSASSLATTANNNAATALNTANAASSAVTTLTGTVNSLGNRMTAAENAISANAGNITTLQNNLATTNANVTAAANAASSAQATATSAQSTATLARNQAYVLRYTGTTITGGGTIAYADIDNTDNIKAGDKIIDISGAIYAIASVDIANQTVTVGASEIINLAVLPDLFNSANTWTGDNTYSKPVVVERNTDTGNFLALRNSVAELGSTPASATPVTIAYRDKNDNNLGYMGVYYDTDGSNTFRLFVRNKYTSGAPSTSGTVDYTTFQLKLNADKSKEGIIKASFRPYDNNTYDLGSSSYQWNNLYAKKINTQSVNGVNPGALSLPDTLGTSGTENVNYFNVIGYLNNTGAIGTIPATATYDGWLYINAKDGADSYIIIDDAPSGFGTSVYGNNGLGAQGIGLLCLICPIRKGHYYNIRIKSAEIVSARIYPAQGNV